MTMSTGHAEIGIAESPASSSCGNCVKDQPPGVDRISIPCHTGHPAIAQVPREHREDIPRERAEPYAPRRSKRRPAVPVPPPSEPHDRPSNGCRRSGPVRLPSAGQPMVQRSAWISCSCCLDRSRPRTPQQACVAPTRLHHPDKNRANAPARCHPRTVRLSGSAAPLASIPGPAPSPTGFSACLIIMIRSGVMPHSHGGGTRYDVRRIFLSSVSRIAPAESPELQPKWLMIGRAAGQIHLAANDAWLQVLRHENKIARERTVWPLLMVIQPDRGSAWGVPVRTRPRVEKRRRVRNRLQHPAIGGTFEGAIEIPAKHCTHRAVGVAERAVFIFGFCRTPCVVACLGVQLAQPPTWASRCDSE